MGIDPSCQIIKLLKSSSATYVLHLIKYKLSGKSTVSSNNSKKCLFWLRLFLIGSRFYSGNLLQVSFLSIKYKGNMLIDKGKAGFLGRLAEGVQPRRHGAKRLLISDRLASALKSILSYSTLICLLSAALLSTVLI